jgi:hypothetical protein
LAVPRAAVDLLIVSPATTGGWRRVDATLMGVLDELGVTYAQAVPGYRIARPLWELVARRLPVLHWPVSDLSQAAAMSVATAKALRAHRPRAILFSSMNSVLLQPRRRLRRASGLRFDSPAAVNRPERVNVIQHRLEQRAMRELRLLLPLGVEPHPRVVEVVPPGARLVALPVPVDPVAPEPGGREGNVVMTYVPVAEKKGLDYVVEAWAAAAPSGARLVVSGMSGRDARWFLSRRGIAEPPGIEWAGTISAEEHRRLRARAGIFLSGSRFEDYGIAQLEAFADGALLVTVPSGGTFPALDIARRLDPRLVAPSLDGAALGEALRAAFAMTAGERADYAARARELIAPYSRAELRRRLEQQVLPELLA